MGRYKFKTFVVSFTIWATMAALVVSPVGIRGRAASVAQAQTTERTWSDPVNISNTTGSSWFPDLAGDSRGNVHVIWCESSELEEGGHKEQVFYSMWNGESWSDSNDIVPPSPDIIRNAIAVDRRDTLHMLFGGSVYGRNYTLYYHRAYVEGAWSAAAWSAPHLVNQGDSYMGDVAVDSQGTIHVIYDDTIRYEEDTELAVADIFYRRLVDGEQTWSPPVNLFASRFTGSSRPQMEIDSGDTIHVTWDEGWDRLTGSGDPSYGAYTFSSDGGRTWFPPIVVTHPDSTVAQLTVGSDGRGGVMLVWRAVSQNEIFYQWSTDGGHSWGAPSTIPEIFSRPWTNPFDMYDMAADSAGHIHLVVVGRRVQDNYAPLGVYHLEWDGTAWSGAERIYGEMGFPEYPKIAVSQGNQLHVTWFVRESQWGDPDAGPHQVWYSSGQSTAPHQVVTPLPTATFMSPTFVPRSTPTPTATPHPTLSADDVGLPDGLKTEGDDVVRLAIALSPVAVVVLIVMATRMGWFGKLRR
jgi:hypothetical protein